MESAGRRSAGAVLAIVAAIAVVGAMSFGSARDKGVVLNAQSAGAAAASEDSSGVKAAIEREIADRRAADEALRLELQGEIDASQSAVTDLRDALAEPNTPDEYAFINIDSNEIVDGAIESIDLADGTIVLADLNTLSIDTMFATDDELADETAARSVEDAALSAFDDELATSVNGGVPNSVAPGDALVDWSRLKGVPVGFADNVDNDSGADAYAALEQFKGDLATPHATGVNSGEGLVDFTQLENVSIGDALITDVDVSKLTGQIGTAQIASSAITGDKLALATDKGGEPGIEAIQNDNIEARTILGDRLVLGAITALELGVDAVTTDKIQDGQVTRSDLADGAVSTAKTTANIAGAAGVGGVLNSGTSSIDATQTFLTIPESGVDHKILVTGQVQLNCTVCDSSLESFTYTVKRSGGTAGDGYLLPSYTVAAGGVGSQIVLPISLVDTVAQSGGSVVYTLEVSMTTASGTDSVAVVSPMLIATDLGRA